MEVIPQVRNPGNGLPLTPNTVKVSLSATTWLPKSSDPFGPVHVTT